MQWATRRRLHTRKELPYKIEEGLGNFMSPQTLNMVAVEYQQGLLDRLSEQCRGKQFQSLAKSQLEFSDYRCR
jgi:Fe-Mn family superoxide dismutase